MAGIEANLLQRSPAVGDFYDIGIEISAGFGLIGSTEKKGLGRLWATLEGGFFMLSGAKKNC